MNFVERANADGPARGARSGWDWPEGSLLGSLNRHARDQLLRLGTLVQYPGPSRILIRQGEQSRFVFVILDRGSSSLATSLNACGVTPTSRMP